MSRRRSGNSTPPEIRDYFERVGDIGIYEERLLELLDTHEEGLIERDFLRDQNEVPSPSDDEFHRLYQYRRDQIESDLNTAKMETEALQEKARAAGYDVDEHRERKNSLYSSSHAASSHVDLEPIPQIRQVKTTSQSFFKSWRLAERA